MKPYNAFYSVKPIEREVTKEEYDQFISQYPRRLRMDCWAACDPPLIAANDFELADRWPYSIVAGYDGGEPNEYYGWDYKPKYYVVVNYEDLFNHRTGYKADEDPEEIRRLKEWNEMASRSRISSLAIDSISSIKATDITTGATLFTEEYKS